MEQITIKIDGVLLEQMKDRMTKKECKTLSQCARELMELALRIEKAASSQEGENDANALSPALMDLFKTNMMWLLETRFLVRFLVENKKDIDAEPLGEFMKKAKERAVSHIGELMKGAQSD